MTVLQGAAAAVLVVMVMVWFNSLSKLSRLLRDRHPEKYDEMELDDLWGFPNRGTVVALFRFLDGGEFEGLDDPQVRSLSVFMRGLLFVFLMLFVFLVISIESQSDSGRVPETVAATPAPAIAPASEADLIYSRAVDHFRAQRNDEALADFRRVIDLEPSNFQAHRAVDAILAAQQRWDEILALWDGYLRVEPRDANAYYERGGTNYRKGDFAASYADAAKACELGKAAACPRAERLKSMLK